MRPPRNKLLSVVYRLMFAGVFIFLLLWLGYGIYIYELRSQRPIVSAKEFEPVLSESKNQNFELIANDKTIKLKNKEVGEMLEEYIRFWTGKKDVRVSTDKVEDYLISIAPNINREPVNARFTFLNNRAEIFLAHSPGRRLNIDKSAAAIVDGLIENKNPISLIVDEIEPEITLEKINSLGIDTLLATGTSDFAGSSAGRLLNIKIASAKYNGLILKPGEEFSFNNVLGEVEATGGYAAEKVIKSGKLVYEYGGGICQVSTTLFRAAIAAGFPILERRPHAFPVQYYNPQGFDATIYPGVTDLRFKNDTGGYVIMQSAISGTKISFEIYGGKNNRIVQVSMPVLYDQASDGSMKAYFTRAISYADGTKKEERFNSIYRSPLLYPLEKNPLE
ncbi:MAG: hypothetical protein A3F50_01380 [Candidatus Yanofskybacteria bacterium RIFCSPHIGHO2_12_FULL_44_29b]|uniref:YoaR-like putative peptidoglycan binding domain-containing protein n=1 Tax=Candidatus Yanofskybacteria bacterium RIFCSPLOWO2_02_FULL_44_18 TaxID=1802705 RepID=A0A1F8H0S0_9BACT|nr:MAG: hypothetical protein A3F50_01380 [Candidatus Yanofskybacteria bacterium RIFCSPHIGHO2_12_FULL_44_29b]OGN31262.1 MAG: hypothetical protein A3I96_00405 [Candidatus Yanofskybacteria bacterium RIFCSPLOWO2_02_FULL_44_18]